MNFLCHFSMYSPKSSQGSTLHSHKLDGMYIRIKQLAFQFSGFTIECNASTVLCKSCFRGRDQQRFICKFKVHSDGSLAQDTENSSLFQYACH
jgi:hypothetical protein